MTEIEQIVYTPEELNEIDRILGLIDSNLLRAPEEETVKMPPPQSLEEFEMEQEEPEYAPTPEKSFEGEPEDLDLPPVDFNRLRAKPAVGGEVAEIEDITDLIHEVEEGPAIEELAPGPEPERKEYITGGFEEVPEKPKAAVAPSAELSTLDELDSLTSGEPVLLDDREFASAGAFVDRGVKPGPVGAVPVEKKAPPAQESVEISDLSELSFEERADIPEVRESDISSIDIGDLGAPAAGTVQMEADAGKPPLGDLTDEDLASIKEVHDIQYEKPPVTVGFKDTGQPVSGKPPEMDLHEIPDIKEVHLPEAEEPLVIEKLEDEPRVFTESRGGREAAGPRIDLSDSDVEKFKRAILFYDPGLRQIIKETVIGEFLPAADTRRLVNMILSNRSERDIHRFLESKLKRKIPFAPGRVAPGKRKVISSRPEYGVEGRERQKRLAKITLIFGMAALAACVVVVIGYQFVYKPWAAAQKIHAGAALIRERGDYLKKQKDYAKAEEIFLDVDQNLIKDYVPGYTEYSRAYFDKREYGYSVGKLNKVYRIQSDRGKAVDIDVLNALGYFYARVPKEIYEGIRANINQWYYPNSDKKRAEWSQLDVAIEFYRQVLLRDKRNITALYGIGNAYFFQGEFQKAKKYYEDIVELEPNSAVGYSGLLNLYIERDVFERVIDIHTRLVKNKQLDQVPSPLLAKLASYYLGKKKSETGNVRVDYGMQSTRFKDADDNIFPAVSGVLEALNKRDQNYPPLHLQYARLNKAQKNLRIMKVHLEKAIDSSRKNYNSDYFGALHLMGEYYYQSKEPVKAYEYLNRAIKAAGSPPEFTREDFYFETENVGKSYALTGNIFYYFFDKVRMRYGDLEDENLDEEVDKFANYEIARDKYEKALQEKYESSEVHYNLGRIYYLNRLYQKALNQWLNLYEDFTSSPELMFALGNAHYHMGNLNAAKGQYLKLISVYEYEQEKIKTINPTSEKQVKMMTFLSSAYNNIGAVYQAQNNEAKSNISYWRAINSLQRINEDYAYARVNLARSFKKTGEPGEPILDESIPFSIDVYREDRRM